MMAENPAENETRETVFTADERRLTQMADLLGPKFLPINPAHLVHPVKKPFRAFRVFRS